MVRDRSRNTLKEPPMTFNKKSLGILMTMLVSASMLFAADKTAGLHRK